MKKLIMAVVATIALCGAINAQATANEEAAVVAKVSNEYLSAVPASGYHILAETVLDRIESKKNDFVIIDVRMPKADKYDKGHVPGAIYMGFREIANPENLAKLPKDMDIIVYCDTGHEQNKVLSVLRMLGYRAFDMKWGYSSWKVAGPTGATLKAIEGSISNNYPIQK
jgi:rhodanese-related sulfurtransferase